MRHRLALVVDRRRNSHFTGFLRLATQFSVLTGPVLADLDHHPLHSQPLSIGVLGCSNGAEAHTIASVLLREQPELAFQIAGFDINPRCVAQAQSGEYQPEEIFNNKIITDDFVRTTFDRTGDRYSVKSHIRARSRFRTADILRPDLADRIGPCDVVFVQNVLFHLPPRAARQAFSNVFRLLRPGSVLFADGIDLDLRQALAHEYGLRPLDYEIEQIHNEAMRARGVGWPYHYWGLEPFMTQVKDWKTRYATMFAAT
jgi:chemotaxis protein methyltransferase CheR